MTIQKILEQKKKFVPQCGYNLVGVDHYEIPGSDEALFLIAHTDSLEEARRLRAQYDGNEWITAYIYTPDTA
ncbi:hypothetical protein D770_16610 [Flammeovirgaceae bacterium 311]|nr:hypothetical protein D770_16610 [Flammeovirgaceae bacterium 311]